MGAAQRELQEETGLVANGFWTAPIVGSFFDPLKDSLQMCPLFAAEVPISAEPVLSKEHQGYEWATLERAVELLVWPGHVDAVRTVNNYIVADREAASLTKIISVAAERKMS